MELINGKVRVYNYEQNPIGFPSDVNKNGIHIEASEDEETPVLEYVLFSDIEQENSKSDIFKTGRLRFHPDEEDEIYQKLFITDRENIVTEQKMRKLLMDSSIENLKKIGNIKSHDLISRMKKAIVDMSMGGVTIPNQIVSVVNERYDELRYTNGNKKTDSYLNRIISSEKSKQEENELLETVNKLAKQVEELKKEKENNEKESQNALSDLLQMVQQLKAENESLKITSDINTDDKEKVEDKKTKSKTK